MSMCDIAFVNADDAVIGYPPMRAMTTPDTLFFPWKVSMAQAKYLQLTGNSVTGEGGRRHGMGGQELPEGRRPGGAGRARNCGPSAQIDPALLAANKASVNRAPSTDGDANPPTNGLAMALTEANG